VRRRLEDDGHDRCGCGQQCDYDVCRIESALLGSAPDRGEDLLTVCAARGPVPTATHLTRDHGGPQGVFGAPVRRVERGIKQKAEDGVVFDDQMALKPAHAEEPTGPAREQVPEALDVVTARHSEAMIGDRAVVIAITRAERRLQNRFDRRNKRLRRIVEQQGTTAAQQMGQTALMPGGFELAVRLPAVALQDAGVVDPNHVRGLREPAAGLNGVDGRFASDKGPEPLQVSVDAPARFIGRHDRTATHRRTQRGVGRLRLARGAVHRMHQAAARDRQPKAIAQQRDDFAVGQPETFIQEPGEGDGLRAELHGGGAEGIGGLPRMAPLHAPPTPRARPNVDATRADDRALYRQLFLILRRDAHGLHRAVTLRTRPRQTRLVRLIDMRRRLPVRPRPIRGARFPSRPSRIADPGATRKRRSLTIDRAARGLEFLFQLVVFAPQPLPFGLRPPEIVAQLFILATQPLDLGGLCRGPIRFAVWHAPVMPDSRGKYKGNCGSAFTDPLNRYVGSWALGIGELNHLGSWELEVGS
jgi:hypothetical protein